MDTIFAPATARGKAGVTVIRISGPDAFSASERLVGRLPPSHRAALRTVRALDGDFLDEALVIAFDEGRSFTGEETVELQLHGSIAITNAVLAELADVPGVRLAEPGEFTRRALENNRLDLTQVEGLADLIEAETEAQRKQAQRVLSGAVGKQAAIWRADLVRAAALLEATIDFADEEVPVDVSPEVRDLVDRTLNSLRQQARGYHSAERLRDSFEVAIVGPPNIGKSTLLNALAGREAAITSEVAGTTRDVIEVRMDLAGIPVTVLDTAGLHESTDVVEKIGIHRARERAADADVRVILIAKPGDVPGIEPDEDDLVLVGKCDTAGAKLKGISGHTGAGVDHLIDALIDILSRRVSSIGVITRERHRVAVQQGIAALEAARIDIDEGEERAEFAAENLRYVVRALDSLVGRIGVEDILDEVFSSFCLGK
ncbi:tRNA uridine-5-carboxymethylaminomethyl(34) synthesis GTPase MnmE [Oceaniglobus trochenteri]|uniref:tRNA uridine-5-carboxymethylaminomethyl(34) synthesis GTPase MnmE n=1 Tax=Oceaniglobus trochenteri TaxID=2763260 RepID=UPI001CFF6E99|nr:tRNA uridine-5-carboxymethylaminomethyl(34) synthesis GTPase MnmE [Oceaniglobus trochenteri]